MPNEQTIVNTQNVELPKPQNASDPLRKAEMSSLQDLFIKSWPIYKGNFQKFIVLVLLQGLLIFVLGAIIALFFVLFFRHNPAFYVMAAMIFIFAFIIIVYLSFILQAAQLIIIKNSQEDLKIKEALLRAKNIAGKYIILNLLIGVMVFLWTLLLIVPGVYMSIAYSMAIWIFIYEGIGGMAALNKSRELVKGYWLPVCGRYIVIYLAIYLVIFLFGLLFAPLGKIGQSAVTQIISSIAMPFFLICTCFMYWDLKKIKNI